MGEPIEKTFAEFFAGIGLMRIGLEKAGWQIALANDIDHDKWQMYKDHFGDTGEFIVDDIHKLKPVQIPTVALATASFPCNDLSLAGARHGLAGEQSSAFWGFVDILKTMKRERRMPPLVLLENVTGFLSSHGGQDFEDALLALNDLGYATDAFVVDAARFVPQSRQRLFVVGLKTREVTPLHDSPRFYESELRSPALASFILMHPDINWRIRYLPPLPKNTRRLARILEDLPPNHAMWWSRKRSEYMLSQMSPKHRAQADSMIKRKWHPIWYSLPPSAQRQIYGRVANRRHRGLSSHAARRQWASNSVRRRQWSLCCTPSYLARMRPPHGGRRLHYQSQP